MVVNCELHIPLCFQCCPHITVTQSCSLFGLSKGGFFRVTGQQVLGPPFISRSKKPHQGLYIPSGKHTNNYGKSPFFMGKSTISMAIFNSYFDITRGYNLGSVGVASDLVSPPKNLPGQLDRTFSSVNSLDRSTVGGINEWRILGGINGDSLCI